MKRGRALSTKMRTISDMHTSGQCVLLVCHGREVQLGVTGTSGTSGACRHAGAWSFVQVFRL